MTYIVNMTNYIPFGPPISAPSSEYTQLNLTDWTTIVTYIEGYNNGK